MIRLLRTMPPLFFVALSLLLFRPNQTDAFGGEAATQTAVSNAHHLQFTLTTPAATLDAAGQPHIHGLAQTLLRPDAPALPIYTTLIAIPPAADLSVQVVPQAVKTSQATAPLPATEPQLANAAASFGDMLETSQLTPVGSDAAIYETDALYPTTSYTISEPMYYRGVRLVRLQLYPLRYNPVRGELQQAQQLAVSIAFNNGQPQATIAKPDPALARLKTAVFNPQHLSQWQQPPDAAPTTELPVGRNSYKIEITADGIYQISYADLQAVGMAVTTVNPHTFAMLHRGQPVAYQFIGDSDNQFEPGEAIRFYGWAFNGSRYEKLYTNTNVFWLWANGTPATISTIPNNAGQSGYPETNTFRDQRIFGEDVHYFSGWQLDWSQSPNEPDMYFWQRMNHTTDGETLTIPIELPHPAAAADATYTAEIAVRKHPSAPNFTYEGRLTINDEPTAATETLSGARSFNISHTVPAAALRDGSNDIHLTFASDYPPSSATGYYLNQMTVDYTRQLQAVTDQLIFRNQAGGQHTFRVQGFSNGSSDNAIVWDISTPHQPQQVTLSAAQVVAESGAFSYLIGRGTAENGRFIATTTANIQPVPSLTQYTTPNIDAPGQAADWLVITHADFASAAQRLAQHRAQPAYGGLQTHVVDIQDITNQYGYGLPITEAIRSYLRHALANWQTPPSYVLLLGDGTANPLHIDCPTCTTWSTEEINYIPTDFAFVDRWQGQIISDHTLVLLSGDDLIADMAIGRISAHTPADADDAVDKIIWFEQQIADEAAWQQNVLFTADNDDPGAGFFCAENEDVGQHLPGHYQQTHLCFDESEIVGGVPSQEQTDAYRNQISQFINNDGASITNYRGHGSPTTWASPSILSTADSAAFWQNFGKPTVLLSADCWDGYFAWPGMDSLSETWIRLDSLRGTAAHWSSSGLGFSFEHTVLHRGFYDALDDANLSRIGDAILYAKLGYAELDLAESELYSFTLQGDPALQLYQAEYLLSLPIIVRQ